MVLCLAFMLTLGVPSATADVVPRDVAAAARTLLDEPVELARDAGKVWYVNGQHRTEAMLRQGVEEAVMVDTRLIDERPLPGEIGRICVW